MGESRILDKRISFWKGRFLWHRFTYHKICKQEMLRIITLGASHLFTGVTILKSVKKTFLLHDLTQNSSRIMIKWVTLCLEEHL